MGTFFLVEARWGLFLPCDREKQSQLLLRPTEVQLCLQVGVEFENIGKFHMGRVQRVNQVQEQLYYADFLQSRKWLAFQLIGVRAVN